MNLEVEVGTNQGNWDFRKMGTGVGTENGNENL